MAKQAALRILQLSLSNQFDKIDLNNAFEQLAPHYLAAWFYHRHRLKTDDSRWHTEYTRQSLQNTLIIRELESLESVLPTIRLKGTSFFPWLYRDIGERHLTDADLLVSPDNLPIAIDILTERGYKLVNQIKWDANFHRVSLTRESTEKFLYQVDLHTQLHWEQSSDLSMKTHKVGQYDSLTKPVLFYHLCMNWAFQDTFIGLNKLLDIHLLWNSLTEQEQAETEKIFFDSNYEKVWDWCMRALAVLKGEKDKMLSEAFLSNPKRYPMKYFGLKHLNKKNLGQALKYDLLWLGSYLKNSEKP